MRQLHHYADSNRGHRRCLKSPKGRRGAICEHFGWTYDYLTEDIPWCLVQRMTIDTPSHEVNDPKEENIRLTLENADSIMAYINGLG